MNQTDDLSSSKVAEIFPGVYSLFDPKNPSKKLLATRNLTPGKVYYGERTTRVKTDGETLEFRFWDPFRSKLSASILRGLKIMPFREGTVCLYLGASTGTTVSHLSDIVGDTGRIFAVEAARGPPWGCRVSPVTPGPGIPPPGAPRPRAWDGAHPTP